MIELSPIVACICEGGAETAIMDMLLDYDMLKFSREQMLNEEIISCRNAKVFEQRYLRKSFESEITILRILDSHTENFKLSTAYQNKIARVYNVVTAPEIEMLMILAKGKYKEYMKESSTKLPSEFCKQDLNMPKTIKSQRFVREFFSDINTLSNSIHEYKRVKKLKKDEIYLADLLK